MTRSPSRASFVVLLLLAAACSKAAPRASDTSAATATAAPAIAASASAPADMPALADAKQKADEHGGKKAESKPTSTWKRASSSTHAARITIGDKEQIPLRGVQMKVDIDGFRARVVMDALFENDRSGSYEGNFQLRLPDDATPYFF